MVLQGLPTTNHVGGSPKDRSLPSLLVIEDRGEAIGFGSLLARGLLKSQELQRMKKKRGNGAEIADLGCRRPPKSVAPLVAGPSCRYRDRRNSSTTTATTTVQLLVTIERKKTVILAKSRSGCDPV